MRKIQKSIPKADPIRKENPWVEPLVRIKDYNDFHKILPKEKRLEQAERCLHCGVPFCQSAIKIKNAVTGCPLHNLIPEFNEQLALDNEALALERLLKTNPFPEFTSRVCPALCEKACIHGLDDGATTIHDNEQFIIENGFANNWVQPVIPEIRTGQRVAVIGSGPAGLSAAHYLNRRGHEVDVFEREDQIGGLLMYGIPNMKLEKEILSRRRKLMEEEGIRFFVNCDIGKNVPVNNLQDYDAIVLACGSRQARSLPAVTEPVKGIFYAVDYLTDSTKKLLHGNPSNLAKDKNVIIVGGGDTGNDCVGTAIRQGAKSIVQLEMMPKKPEERLQNNPWPEWPNVDKVDYGTQEAIAVFGEDPRLFSKTVKEIHVQDGKLQGITIVSLDENLKPVENSEVYLECDLLLIAAGFTGIESYVRDSFKLPVTNRNTIETEDYQIEGTPLFACGDARRGQSLVVWAISEGKECAKAVDEYLMGYSNLS